MSRIYKTTDRIEIKVDDISVFISPLTYHQKMSLQIPMFKAANGNMDEAMKLIVMALKMSVKDIKGVVIYDENGKDTEYKLEFDGEELSEECANDLLNLPCSNKISSICSALLSGVPDQLVDHTGKPLEGVSFVKPKMEKSKAKK